jgi:hypothetical protein
VGGGPPPSYRPVDPGICPKCGAAILPSTISSSGDGEWLSEHVTCGNCAASLSRKEDDMWREDLRELLSASINAERARLEALRAWARFWIQQPEESEASKAWAAIAGPELAHFFVRMSREDARHVLELLRRWDEPEHSPQERENMIQELRALGLQQPPRMPVEGAEASG